MNGSAIIKTKLNPPKVRNTMIRRARLYQKLKKISHFPVTIIHSGAGYGKSTALSLYIQDIKLKSCWYSISSHDDDFLPFFTYMIHSIQTHHPSFGHYLLKRLDTGSGYFRENEILEISSLFINEIVTLNEEVVLILDDFHHVDRSPSIEEFMLSILEHFPTNLHLVISSRSRPRWKALTHFKVKGNLLEVNQKDLELTQDEIELLFTEHYELTLSEEELTSLFQLTDGWVIALGIIGQQLQEETDLNKIMNNRTKSLDDLFQYIVLEVFLKQTPMIQKFLEQTSILEEISQESCVSILQIDGADGMLESLFEKNVFIQSSGEGQFRYHALFKELLEKRFKELQPLEYDQLHERAARYYERKGMIEKTLYHLEKSGRMDAVAKILQSYGLTMLREGKLHSLQERLRNISEEDKNRCYILWYFEAEIYRFRSDYIKAESCYERVIFYADRFDDPKMKSLAVEGKARIYLDTIQPGEAERYLQLAIELRENSVESKEDMTELYHLMAENLINAGKAKRAEKWLQRGRELNIRVNDGNLMARLNLRTGNLLEAKRILLEKKNDQPFNEVNHIPQYHRETDLILALIESFIGNAEESKRLSQHGIQQGIQMKSRYTEACGWIRMGHSVQLLESYDSSLALQCYQTSLNIMEEIKNPRGKAEPYMGLSLYFSRIGQYDQGIEYGEKAIEETKKVEDMWLSAYILLGISIGYVYTEQWIKAKEKLNESERMFLQCEDSYGLTLSALWRTFVAFHCREWETFDSQCKKLLQNVELGPYDFIFLKPTTFGLRDIQQFVPILLEAQKRDIGKEFVSKILHHFGYEDLLLHPGYTLKIQTLGSFKVWLGNQEVKDRDWQRAKAKELFELLITKRNEVVQKQEIVDLLWPKQDEKTAERDFKVVLNALNSALEPGRKARTQSFFIKRSGTGYGLNPDAVYLLDTKDFEDWVQAGIEEANPQNAKAYLERGMKLYAGDYLPERRFEDWCINERERLLVLFLRGAEKLAQVSIRSKDYNNAVYWCEKILEKDKTWEEAYRLLMYCYYMKNNRPQSVKWYRKCFQVLMDEMGVEPLEATNEMYRMVLDAGPIEMFEEQEI